ncbi:MAG: endonuclease domain-containing protein [Pirellulaceae bacterium]
MAIHPSSVASRRVLLSLWDGVPPGKTQLVTTPDVGSVLAQLATWGPAELDDRRILAVTWERLPSYPRILEDALDMLAEAARSWWPQWYPADHRDEGHAAPHALHDRARMAGVERLVVPRLAGQTGPMETQNTPISQSGRGEESAGKRSSPWPSTTAALHGFLCGHLRGHPRLRRFIVPRWLELADNACRAQRAPRWPNAFTAEVEVRQLALALGVRSSRLVFAARDESQDRPALLGLARTAEWLARESQMPLVVLLPSSLARAPELDSISFRQVELPGDAAYSPASSAASGAESTSPAPRALPAPPPQLLVHPLIGRPHPGSRGEQLLWDRLQSDAELAELFLCNQWCTTVCQTTYIVDFIWATGKVIVEVDGYYWHSQPWNFAHDRNRDYEFQLSGYLVLRLPHDEVLEDTDGAMNKIRRLVHLRQRRRDDGDGDQS